MTAKHDGVAFRERFGDLPHTPVEGREFHEA